MTDVRPEIKEEIRESIERNKELLEGLSKH